MQEYINKFQREEEDCKGGGGGEPYVFKPTVKEKAEDEMLDELNFVHKVCRNKSFDRGFRTGYSVGNVKGHKSGYNQAIEEMIYWFENYFPRGTMKGMLSKLDKLKTK